MSEQQTLVHKVTLNTGKIVFLREMDNKKEELAFQAAAGKAGGNEVMIAYHAKNEILKLLLAAVKKNADSETWKPTAMDLELLDKHITYAERKQLEKVVSKLMGEESGSDPVIETDFSGTL